MNDKIIVYIGDSFVVSCFTDYDWLTKKNLIDDKKINYFEFIRYSYIYKKNNSFFSYAQDIKRNNSWTNRLANKLNMNYINLGMIGASWQSMLNQIMFALLNIKNKKIIFIIACTRNERILVDKLTHNLTKDMNLLDFYDSENIKNYTYYNYLLNNYNHQIKNKTNLTIDALFKEEEIRVIDTLFTKKIFSIYNIQAIICILNILKNYTKYFLPTWYETLKDQMFNITNKKEILNNFIFNNFTEEELSFKSPFTLKTVKSNPYTPHPSFDSQESIATHYYDFLKNKI